MANYVIPIRFRSLLFPNVDKATRYGKSWGQPSSVQATWMKFHDRIDQRYVPRARPRVSYCTDTTSSLATYPTQTARESGVRVTYWKVMFYQYLHNEAGWGQSLRNFGTPVTFVCLGYRQSLSQTIYAPVVTTNETQPKWVPCMPDIAGHDSNKGSRTKACRSINQECMTHTHSPDVSQSVNALVHIMHMIYNQSTVPNSYQLGTTLCYRSCNLVSLLNWAWVENFSYSGTPQLLAQC